MSLYTVTESNMYRPCSCDFIDFQKFSNVNQFCTSKNFYSNKCIPSPSSTIKFSNNQSLYNTKNTFLTPTKITKTKSQINIYNPKYSNNSIVRSYKDLSNYSDKETKIRKLFNPDILNAHYISRPKKFRNKISTLEIPKFNTFLGNKIKTKSINFNTFDIINGNSCKIFSSNISNKPKINRGIRDFRLKKLGYLKNCINNNNMKLLVERSKRRNKRPSEFIINQFKQKLINDKKENLREFNNYMNVLQMTLNKSKSKSKPKNKLIYE